MQKEDAKTYVERIEDELLEVKCTLAELEVDYDMVRTENKKLTREIATAVTELNNVLRLLGDI